MKWIASVVVVNTEPVDHAVELISNLFEDIGLSGVVVEDPDLEPLEGWGEDALPKPEYHTVTGYFPNNESLTTNCRKLEKGLADLKRNQDIDTHVIYHEIDDEDWAESWKTYFWPEKLTDILVVKPTWREYTALEGEIVIEIDPGMAFGTGTHPTTSLCAEMIQKFLKEGESFLDVGTGSGILMIVAAKLGASILFGVDSDRVACDIAERNLLLNQVDTNRFCVKFGDLVNNIREKFHLISANILTEVILLLLDHVQHVLLPGGILICSGIIEANRNQVIDKMKSTGFKILTVEVKEGWVAIAGRR